MEKKIDIKLMAVFFIFLFSQGCSWGRSVHRKYHYGVYHTVRRGETLSVISRGYDVSLAKVKRANHLRNPDILREGQKIYIPGAARVLFLDEFSQRFSSPKRSTKKPIVKLPRLSSFHPQWPVQGIITSKFGPRPRDFHEGIDIAVAKNTPIEASDDGQVSFSGQMRGYGNVIIIKHNNKITTLYAHNRVNQVETGKRVRQGDIIGKVGSTGRSTNPHLHFEIRADGKALDPLKYLPRRK